MIEVHAGATEPPEITQYCSEPGDIERARQEAIAAEARRQARRAAREQERQRQARR